MPDQPATAADIPYEGTDCTADEAVDAVAAVRAIAAPSVYVSHECYGDRHADCVWPRCECGCHRGTAACRCSVCGSLDVSSLGGGVDRCASCGTTWPHCSDPSQPSAT